MMILTRPLKEEDMRPAHFVRQPAHNRRENNRGKVFARVKDSTAVPLLRRGQGCNSATVPGRRRRFRQTNRGNRR